MTSLDGVAGLLGRASRGVTLAARTVLPVDTNPVPADWTHVTKVDPEDEKKLPLLFPLYLRHTSAVSVGGSADVNARNTEETFDLLGPASVPVFHEPSGPRHVTPKTRKEAALLAIPEVLNGDSESLVGQLGEGTEYIRDEMVPEMLDDALPWCPKFVADAVADFATSWLLADAVFEAYVIQNLDSAAAREANVGESDLLTPREAKQRAMAAERHLGSELIYLEYSGTYGGDEAAETLRKTSENLSWSRLWYGGGIDSRERAEAVLEAGADTVVVGDAFHRVADEEAEVCERAAEALDGEATESAVREWVRENVAVEDSQAAAYLATIPSVPDPERLAERYLTATVRTWLLLRDRADDARPPTAESATRLVRRVLDTGPTADLDDADAALVGNSILALLDDRTELRADGAVGDATSGAASDGASGEPSSEPTADLPTGHFALSLSDR